MKVIEINKEDLKHNLNIVKDILKNNSQQKEIRNNSSC